MSSTSSRGTLSMHQWAEQGRTMEHTLGQWHALVDIPATRLGLAAARHVATGLLPSWELPDELCADAELVISELVTNAITHAPGTDSFELELVRRPNGVRISLADGSSIRPVIRELAREQPSGRGMLLVQNLARDWGAEEHHGGKRVWVSLEIGVQQ